MKHSKHSIELMDYEKSFGAQNYEPLKVVMNKAKGCKMWDVDGTEYIDLQNAYSAVSLGHANKKILKSLNKQATKLGVTSRSVYTQSHSKFLKKMSKLSGFDKSILCNSGAEAVETAIKLSRKWAYCVKKIAPSKAEILVAKNNFHGRTTGIISFSTQAQYKEHFTPLMGGFRTLTLVILKA